MSEPKEDFEAPLFRSAILHALLIGALVYVMTREVPEGNRKSDPIQIDSVSEKSPPRKVAKPLNSSTSHTASSQHSKSSNSVSLSDLGMRMNYSAPAAPPSEPVQSESYSQSTPDQQSDGWDLMNPDPKLARFNQYVYNTVQGWLDRDAYLNPKVLTGTVKVRIWFDGEGNYLESETQYEAIDEDFKAIVARALRKSFANPIPRPFLFVHKKFFIDRMVVVRH